jgi:hypothetical protein
LVCADRSARNLEVAQDRAAVPVAQIPPVAAIPLHELAVSTIEADPPVVTLPVLALARDCETRRLGE